MVSQVRQHYLDLAELAVLVARYDRAAAEAVFAPVADRLVGTARRTLGTGERGPRDLPGRGGVRRPGRQDAARCLARRPDATSRPTTDRPGPTSATTPRPRPASPWPGLLALPPGAPPPRAVPEPTRRRDWFEGFRRIERIATFRRCPSKELPPCNRPSANGPQAAGPLPCLVLLLTRRRHGTHAGQGARSRRCRRPLARPSRGTPPRDEPARGSSVVGDRHALRAGARRP